MRLRAMGFDASGWDPVHFPEEAVTETPVVNIGYVVNVIERATERVEVLRRAWALATRFLIVSARLFDELRGDPGVPNGDGYLTSIGTFQKFYTQLELRDWVESIVGTAPVALGRGVFVAFRYAEDRQSFLTERHRRRFELPQLRRSEDIFDRHKDLLNELAEFVAWRGRVPAVGEFERLGELTEQVGTARRAYSVIRSVTDPGEWDRIEEERAQDLLITIALSTLGGRPRFSEWGSATQRDIRAHFSTYKHACELTDKLLMMVGDSAVRDLLMRESPIGKETPSALYMHITAIEALHPVLRIFEGCARNFVGDIENANIVKLFKSDPKVSYLTYPQFDKEPHPCLHSSMVVQLQTFGIKTRSYETRVNPPILHRKEEFVSPEYPSREKFARLTKQEERAGLFKEPDVIGFRAGWEAALRRSGVRLQGHRLVRV